MSIFKLYNNKKVRSQFMQENDMTFEGFGGLVIHHLVVSEFGYLLRYLTDGKLERFDDFQLINENKESILSAIDDELSKEVLRESEVFGYSREITEGNIKNLQKIIVTICSYVDLCRKLELDIDPKADNIEFTKSLTTTAGGAMVAASLAVVLFGTLGDTVDENILAFIAGGLGGLVGFLQGRVFGKSKKERNHD